MRRLFLTASLIALCGLTRPALAQWSDDFSDGDFTTNPAWSGDTSRWTVVPFGTDFALRTDGDPQSDTLHLSTPSTTAFGSWRFSFRWEGGRPSNFNMVRVFLLADTADLKGSLHGYYLQLGTNSRDLRLYRSDPAEPDGRLLLGQSASDLLAEDDRTVQVDVMREATGTWRVSLDGSTVLTAEEGAPSMTPGAYFGFWVKHSATRGRSYFFDDVVVTGTTGPVDGDPPRLLGVAVLDETRLEVTFDEPTLACTPEHFDISEGIGSPVGFERCDDEGQTTYVLLLPAALLPGRSYVLTARNIPDLSGNVLTEATMPFTTPFAAPIPSHRDVVINEISYDPPVADLEYVELFNRSSAAFDLHDLAISDNRLAPVPLTSETRLLEPGAYAVLVQDGPAFTAQFPGVAFLAVPDWPALNNAGDAVVLWAGDAVIDSVAYLPAWGGTDVALERRDPEGPSQAKVNWASALDPRGGTPGARNSVFAPDRTPPVLRFVDQVAERVIGVLFDEPLDPRDVTPDHFTLGGARPSAAEPVEDGSRIRLTFATAIDADRLVVEAVRDLTGNVLGTAEALVARLAAPGDVRITEIMYDPLADAFDGVIDQPEYVELFNPTARLVSLTGFFWTDLPDERGQADTLRFSFTPAGLPPGGYAVVFSQPMTLSADDLFSQSQLVLAFPEDYAAQGVVLLPVIGSSLGLRNGGDLIRLHRADGQPIGEVLDEPDWHNGGLASTSGISLEKIDPTGPDDVATNWTSSPSPKGGTPGLPNAVQPPASARPPRPGDLILNEILYEPLADADDGLPDQPEYLELFNRSPDALNLNGLFLTDLPDETGHADTLRIGFTPVVLSPGRYAVTFTVPSGVSTADVIGVLTKPFPSLAAALTAGEAVLLPLRRTLGLDNGGDLIRLHADDGALLDEVFYDPSWHHPNLRERRGVSLERIDPDGPSDGADNWTSSIAQSGGSPGQANTVTLPPGLPSESPGLVIEPSPFSPDRDGVDDVAGLRYTLRNDAALIRVRIYDASGRPVRTLVASGLSGRTGTLVWDGLDDEGRSLRIGIYVVFLEAVSAEAGTTEAFKRPVVLARPLN